jgi:hypothetical protein
MNKEILLLELGDASAHLISLLTEIQNDELTNAYDLEVTLKDTIKHISRAYNYRNMPSCKFLSFPENEMRKMCQPPRELIPFSED